MPAPIRGEWWNRPGWSEYGAPRNGGKHWGYDSYTVPRATIYAIGDGIVQAKGYLAGTFGHYIDVFYPDLNVRQREAHMAEESYLNRGAQVTASTALGRVGRTGNAEGIWWIRNGVLLEHDHSQAWRGNTTAGSNNVDPRLYWGGTAGGDIDPILEPQFDFALQRRKREETMYVQHEDPRYPQVYKTFDDANGHLRLRYCNANEAAIAISGGLVLPANDATLTGLGIEAAFQAPGVIPLPNVAWDLPEDFEIDADVDYDRVETMVNAAVAAAIASSIPAIAKAVNDDMHRRTEE